MNKRGAEDLLWNVIMIMLILALTGILISWINGVSSGRLINAQVDAKQAALLIDSARPGTIFSINKSISIDSNKVKAEYGKISFEYSFFNLNKAWLDKEKMELKIEK